MFRLASLCVNITLWYPPPQKKTSIVVLHGKGMVLLQNPYGGELLPPVAAVLSPTAVVLFPDSIKASY